VERQPRSVTVHRFHLWRDASQPQHVHFDVVCSKGTYIRSLAHDLGRACGTAAHLTALRREAVGEYEVGAAWDMQQLAQQLTEQRQQRREAEGRGQEQQLGGPAMEAGQEAAAGVQAG
jgi:tRNA pseudouridine55 synthase